MQNVSFIHPFKIFFSTLFQNMVLGVKTRATKAKKKKKHKKVTKKNTQNFVTISKSKQTGPTKKKKKQQIQIGILKLQIRKRRIWNHYI